MRCVAGHDSRVVLLAEYVVAHVVVLWCLGRLRTPCVVGGVWCGREEGLRGMGSFGAEHAEGEVID